MKPNFGVKAKLLLSFVAFSIVVIVLLWLFEIVFFDGIYRSIKIISVRRAAEELYGISDESVEALVTDSSGAVGLCISIFDENFDVVAEEHSGGQCVVHNLSKRTVMMFYEATDDFEGKCFESHLPAGDIMEILNRNEQYLDFPRFHNGYFREPALSASSDAYDCVLFSQIFYNDLGQERYALISSILLPVDATVETIRFELTVLIGILVVISLIMTVILSKTISKPIVELNKASKRLPEGYFDGKHIKGYREVEELADTLRRSALEIQQVDHLRKELIANASHDLRTPLTLISAYSEAMRDIPGENTPENLQVVIDESHRLSDLVSDLLDLSKLEAGVEQLKKENVELVSYVRQMLLRYKKLTAFQGYDVRFETSKETLWVSADTVKLNQILTNLINNAIRYSGEDKEVAVRLIASVDRVTVEVIDHGEGIPEEKLSQIWDRYYRVNCNDNFAVSGSGLGLSIVKKLLVLHEAQYGVRSTVGKGSVFWFSFPLISEH